MDRKTLSTLYDRRSKYYDILVRTLSLGMDRYYRRAAVQRLSLHLGHCVLDVGCGTGLDLPLLWKTVGPGGRVVGIDLSEGMLQQATKRLFRMKRSDIPLLQGDALCLPFQSHRFDAIFCNYVLSTVSGEQVMREAFRVAKPGASMVFADDRLPSGWFASPAKTLKDLLRNGYHNSALNGIAFLRRKLDAFTITNHHWGLIFIISGISKGETG